MEEDVPAAAAESVATRHSRHATGTLGQQAMKREFRAARSAQLTKQKSSGKAMSSKALNRTNKVALGAANSGKKYASRHCFNIKMAGANKNLKQC